MNLEFFNIDTSQNIIALLGNATEKLPSTSATAPTPAFAIIVAPIKASPDSESFIEPDNVTSELS